MYTKLISFFTFITWLKCFFTWKKKKMYGLTSNENSNIWLALFLIQCKWSGRPLIPILRLIHCTYLPVNYSHSNYSKQCLLNLLGHKSFKSYHLFSKHQRLVNANAYLHKGTSKKLPHRKTNSFMGWYWFDLYV